MVSISKFGDSAIKFTFDDSDHYLMGDGEITVPVNGLILVLDESDMATFKKIDGDPFISFNIADSNFSSKSDLETFYKENMVGSTSVTPEEVQDMIDESTSGLAESSAVTEEISEAVSGKADTSAVTASINAAVSGKMDTSAFNTYSASTDARISEDEEVTSAALNALDDALDDKADTSAVTASIAAAVSGKQDTLIAGTNITISGNVISAEGSSITVDQTIDRNSENPISNKAISITATNGDGTVSNTGGIYKWDFYSVGGLSTNKGFYLDIINGAPVISKYNNTRNLNLVETSAITSSVTSASTDSQVPSAKAVYDALQEGGSGGGKAIEAGRGIAITTGATADTVSFDLPIGDFSTSGGGFASYTVNNLLYGKDAMPYGGTDKYTKTTNVLYGRCAKNNIFGGYNQLSGSTSTSSYSIGQNSSNFIVGGGNIIKLTSSTYFSGNNIILGYNNNITSGNQLEKIYLLGNNNSGSTSNTLIIGYYNKALNTYEIASGKYNLSNTGSTDADKTLFSVGNGTAENARHNAFEIRQNGDIYITKDGSDVKLQDQLGGGGVPESAFTAYTAATDARLAEDEEVTAAALNALDNKYSTIETTIGDINTILQSI